MTSVRPTGESFLDLVKALDKVEGIQRSVLVRWNPT